MMYCVNCDNHVTVDDKTTRKCPNCGKDPDRESPKTIDEALKSLKPRRFGDYRLYEEEIRPLITIERKISIVE